MSTISPLPPHGTYARSVGRPAAGIKGCNCDPCRAESHAYKKRRRLLTATGRSLTVDARPVSAHVRMLLDHGTGYVQLAAMLNMSTNSVTNLANGSRKTISRARAERILALQPTPAPKTSISSLGTVRRVQAMIANGHYVGEIAAESGLNISRIVELAAGRLSSVRRETAGRIAAAYDQLSRTSGASVRSVNRGRREGWPTPAEWAGDIDDPTVDPATWARNDNRRGVPAEDLAEDAEFIMATAGVDLNLAADRLGVPRNTLEKARERTGRRQREAAAA